MRWMRWTAFALLLVAVAASGVRADEEIIEEEIVEVLEARDLKTAKVEVLNRALDVLRVRMEARVQTGEILRELGRLEEALEVYREVDRVWTQGLERIEAMIARIEGHAPAKPVIADAPFLDPKRGEIGVGSSGGAFRGRGAAGRASKADGVRRSRIAVEDALRWLAAHQAPDGSWQSAGFHRWCDGEEVKQGPDGLGKQLYDPGVTGLTLCAFLGAGYTNRGNHPFAKNVSKGLRYLKNIQDAEGCFGPRTSQHFIYNHGTASLAMIEAYGMTLSPIFKASAQKALDFIQAARNPYFAWRYGVRPGDNDTSVTGWMVACLHSARLINEDAQKNGRAQPFTIDTAALDGARAWIDKMTDPDYGRTGYIQRGGSPARPMEMIDKFPGEKSEAMTAEGMLIRIWTGEDPRRSALLKKGAELLMKLPPTWNPQDGSIDMYYWYFGTLAMFHMGGAHWRTWNQALGRSVVANQRKDTTYCMYKGSWDPIGPWGIDGGRVYSTAMMAMALQVHYRYEKVFGK